MNSVLQGISMLQNAADAVEIVGSKVYRCLEPTAVGRL